MSEGIPHLRYRDLLSSGGRQPIPPYINNMHHARIIELLMMGARDWTPADWSVNTVNVGGSTAASLVNTNGGTVQGPMLQITTAATAGDGISASMLQKPYMLPTLAGGQIFYCCFEYHTGTNATTAHRAFGIASGTGAQAFDLSTGATFGTGGGICWRSVNSAAWELVVKPTTLAEQVIATATLTPTGSNSQIHRLGFLYVGNAASDANAIGTLFGFAHILNQSQFSGGQGNDDQDNALNTEFYPSVAGRTLDAATFGEASDIRAGLFFAHGAASASARFTYIKRILAIDNLRR